MEDHFFVRGGHIGAGGADGGVGGKKNKCKCTHTHTAILFVGRRPLFRLQKVQVWTKLLFVCLKCSGSSGSSDGRWGFGWSA